jgi:CheY-like chemotaxis protein
MKKIFLVDDDAVVRALYQRQLEQGGFEVCLAQDGLQAIQWLTTFTPDLVLLDLMMPRLAGESVLRFIRSHPQLAKLPVVVLTNAFMSDQARAVSDLGVEGAIVKADCTPAKMLELARQLLGVTPPLAAAPLHAEPGRPIEAHNTARTEFLTHAGIQIADLRELGQEFKSNPEAAARSGNLAELYGQTHLLAAAAGLADCRHLALLGGALEALLYELVEKPQFINGSTARTVVAAVECLARLRTDTQTVGRNEAFSGEVLIVDDDALANRVALAALNRAKLNARTVENSLLALDLLAQSHFDLFLLDIEMPQLNGYELCRQIRCLPGYEKTPVIYVTGHTDFESRAQSILAGGNDLIAKPIFAIELAVKAVMHLLGGRLAAVGPAAL